MSEIINNLPSILLLSGILILSAIITKRFTRAMYYTCPECRALNAKRRTLCRACGSSLAGTKKHG